MKAASIIIGVVIISLIGYIIYSLMGGGQASASTSSAYGPDWSSRPGAEGSGSAATEGLADFNKWLGEGAQGIVRTQNDPTVKAFNSYVASLPKLSDLPPAEKARVVKLFAEQGWTQPGQAGFRK